MRRLVLLLLAGLGGIGVGACSYDLRVAPCQISCASDLECPGGLACTAGRCQARGADVCRADAATPADAPGAAAGPEAGAPSGPEAGAGGGPEAGPPVAGGCAATGCAPGRVCCPAGQRCAGMCVEDCRGLLAGCGGGDVCNAAIGICQPPPAPGPDAGSSAPPLCGGRACGPGQVCCPPGLGCANMCVGDCRLGAHCPSNLACNPANGVCTPPDRLP
jgi:hypothetical protein